MYRYTILIPVKLKSYRTWVTGADMYPSFYNVEAWGLVTPGGPEKTFVHHRQPAKKVVNDSWGLVDLELSSTACF